MGNFFKSHWLGIFITSVLASLVAAYIYERVSIQPILRVFQPTPSATSQVPAKAKEVRQAEATPSERSRARQAQEQKPAPPSRQVNPTIQSHPPKDRVSSLKLTTYADIHIDGGSYHSLAFSPSSSTLALGTGRGPIEIWSLESKSSLHRLVRPTSDSANSLAFFPDGSLIAAGYADNTVKIWHAHARSIVRTFVFGADVRAVAVPNDGKLLAAAGDSHPIKVWNAKSWTLVNELSVGSDYYYAKSGGRSILGYYNNIVFSPDNAYVASSFQGARQAQVRVWNIAAGTLALEIPAQPELYVKGLSFSPKGKYMAWREIRLSSKDQGAGDVYLYDFSTNTKTKVAAEAKGFVFLTDDTLLSLSSSGAAVWTLTTGQNTQFAFGGIAPSIWVLAIALSPDGRFLAASFQRSNIAARVWTVQK